LQDRARAAEAIAAAWRLGGGIAEVSLEGRARPVRFSEGMRCDACGRELRPPQPRLFSYNPPLGACDACQGFGRTTGMDLEKIIPDERLTLKSGAIAPWRTEKFSEWREWLEEHARKRKYKLPLDVPWCELSKTHRKMVIDGFGEYTGIRGWFRYLEKKRYKMHYRILLARYRGYTQCDSCAGSRPPAAARSWLIGGKNISELEAMPVSDLRPWLRELSLGPQAHATAAPLLLELDRRPPYPEPGGLG